MIQRKILLAVLIASIGISYFVYATYRDHQRALKAQEWVNNTNEIIKNLDEVFSSTAETESAVRAYAFTGDWAFMQDFSTRINQLETQLNTTGKMVTQNQVQAENLTQLQALIGKKLKFQDSIIAAKKASSTLPQAIILSKRGKVLMDSIRAEVTEMKTFETELLGQQVTKNREVSQQAHNSTLIAGIVAFLFTIIILWMLGRDNKLRKSAEKRALQNELKYRQLIENSGVVTFTTDFFGNFTFASPQAFDLTAYTVEQILTMNYLDLVADDYKEDVTNFYKEQFRQQLKESTVQFPITTQKGEFRWVEQLCILVINRDGPVGLQCIVKDITKQKLVEVELQKAEADNKEYQRRIQAILDHTPVMMYVKDLEGKYTLVNRKFKETFGLSDEGIIGKSLVDLPGKNSLEVFSEADKKVLLTGKAVEFEETLVFGDRKHEILTMKFPLFDKDNNIFGISGISKDISEMVRFREQLIHSRKKAEQAEKLQEQFLANMSHEIRTPMNGIVGMTNLLAETPLSLQQKEFVDLILQSSNTLLVLINDILDLSKIKAGKLTIEKIVFDLPSVLNRVVAAASIKASEKRLPINLHISTDVPQQVTGDPYRLEQIIGNLLSNAVKFTSAGEVTINVELASKDEDIVTVGFEVTDTGIGIPSDKLEHIFDSFAQADTDTSRKFGGTGLGLAITRNLVQLQEGTMGVNSKPGKGTTFNFQIPYRQIAVVTKQQKQPSRTTLSKYQLPGRKVLIVEDNQINQKVLFHRLERMGIVATIAGNGKEAIDLLEAGSQFELIIMDLQMPEMNGFQATTYIRKKLLCNTPILAMTASVLCEERAQCLEIGMNGYLSKPFDPDEFVETLQQFLPSNVSEAIHQHEWVHYDTDSPYDLTYLNSIGEERMVCEVLELFLLNTPVILCEIKEELLHENWDEVYQKAHKLKSSVGILKIQCMLDGLKVVESNAKNKEQVENVLPLLEKLEQSFSLIRPMLEAERRLKLSSMN